MDQGNAGHPEDTQLSFKHKMIPDNFRSDNFLSSSVNFRSSSGLKSLNLS